MEYRVFGETVVVRLDKGEEIHEQLHIVAEQEQIHLATVQGIGTLNEFKVGVFNAQTQKYHAYQFHGNFEITSLSGTITTKDGACFPHLHMSAANQDGVVMGGHLNRAVVSVTCELVIHRLPGLVGREPDPESGLQILKF